MYLVRCIEVTIEALGKRIRFSFMNMKIQIFQEGG